MSRLNTMYPNDEFLKGISNVMGKIDSKNEIEIKQEIEQVGYKEFYRYCKEKDIYIRRLKQENQQKEDNWNKLKEWLEEDTEEHYYNFEMGRCFNYRDILDKMQEIEGGMNE